MNKKQSKIGKTINFFRVLNNISIKELSERSNISISYINDLERGKRTNISIDKLKLLSKSFGISSTLLMEIIEFIEEKELPDNVLFLYILKIVLEKEVMVKKDLIKFDLVQKILK